MSDFRFLFRHVSIVNDTNLSAARAYSIMPFVWSIGTIVGPCIGGTFADPHETWPDTFPRGSLFDRFPYLLPNLVCAALLFISIILGYFLLEETLPALRSQSAIQSEPFLSEETPLGDSADALKRPAVELRDETYGTFQDQNPQTASELEAPPQKVVKYNIFSNKRIMAVVISLSIYVSVEFLSFLRPARGLLANFIASTKTYHAMCYDHLLPIFFEDDKMSVSSLTSFSGPLHFPGGLGLTMNTVGMIMAVNGAIALFIQAVIFPIAAAKIGVFRLFLIVTVLHPIAYLLMPFLVWVPESFLYPAIYFCLTVRDVFSIIIYPLLLILIKDSTPSSAILGKVNGFAASAGAACRMIAPPVAGYLYALGSRMDCTALAWWGSAVAACIGAIQCFSVERPKSRQDCADEEESLLPQQKTSQTVTVTAISGDDD